MPWKWCGVGNAGTGYRRIAGRITVSATALVTNGASGAGQMGTAIKGSEATAGHPNRGTSGGIDSGFLVLYGGHRKRCFP